MLEVCLLGTGATMPLPGRGTSAAAAALGGRRLLFDCGEGTQTAMRREHVSPVKVDLIALTHYHGDHIFGLPGLLQTMACLERTEPLTITGPRGLREAMDPILRLAGPMPYEICLVEAGEGFRLSLHELHPGWPRGAALDACPTEHRVPSVGYALTLARPPRFDPDRARQLGIPVSYWKTLQQEPDAPVKLDGRTFTGREVTLGPRRGLKLVFSGDTRPCEALTRLSRDADLLIHDATYALDEDETEAEAWGHSTFRGAAAVAARAVVRRLWLTHFSQSIREPEAFLGNARAVFPATDCGRDGRRITLRFTED